MVAFEKLLEAQAKEDLKDKLAAKQIRRFMVVEGLYANYGDLAPLKKLVELKYKYQVRIIIEESLSFGNLFPCSLINYLCIFIETVYSSVYHWEIIINPFFNLRTLPYFACFV